MAVSKAFIQDLHDRLRIEDVVSSYVNLTRAGKNMKGLCPFHNEKTASFTIFPDTNSFYCFGCGAGGDVINFIMRMENLDYVEALKRGADLAGISMPDDGYDDSYAKIRLRILSANREAARFFNSELYKKENAHALEYYAKRGLSVKTITHFGLGYAPDDWHALTNYLKSKGYTEQDLVLANLARRRDGKSGCYDNFRNRIMFPIIDLRGNVVAFSGRVLDDSKPKYVNTSDTPVYKKGNVIFGLNFAKNNSEKKLIVVEGQMDVIALHQAGFTNAVACLGTAFTSEQANILSRYADEVLLCYDNDEAGKKATARVLSILNNTGIRTKVINMEGGKDPDEIIRNYGRERFISLIEGAANRVEYALNEQMRHFDIRTDDGKAKFLSSAAEILAGCSPVERDIYSLRLSNEFGISKEALEGQIKMAYGKLRKRLKAERERDEFEVITNSFEDKNNPQKAGNLRAAKAEERLITSLMKNPAFYKDIKDKFTPDDFITDFNKRVITHLIYLIENNYATTPAMFASEFSADEMGTISLLEVNGELIGNTVKECEDCIAVIKQEAAKGTANPAEMSDAEFLNSFKK